MKVDQKQVLKIWESSTTELIDQNTWMLTRKK
jgi:hypothetical protein